MPTAAQPPSRAPDALPGDPAAKAWAAVPKAFRAGSMRLPPPWERIFGPLRSPAADDGLMVVAQIGQSLDGRIATETGHSHYINGPAGLNHLHRLRALVDAVVVGVGTALADDPQLTVRRVFGPNPARVVLDPRGRLPAGARLLANDGTPRLVLMAEGVRSPLPSDIEIVGLPRTDGQIPPAAVLTALAERGYRRVLIEGGADTISRFLAAKCLDRLHVVVAPMIMGSGRPSFALPPIGRADEALRIPMHAHPLDDEVLFDCDLSSQRFPVGRANRST